MRNLTDVTPHASRGEPWNKGKLIGPLQPKHAWSIRTKQQLAGQTRDLAMFNLAIVSKLRGCDVIRLRVEDVAPQGHAVDRATVRQKKTGQSVKFEMTEQTREAIDNYIAAAEKRPGEIPLRRPSRAGPTYYDATVRPTGRPMDCQHWSGLENLRDSLTAPNQSDPHLPPNWQPAGSSASTGAQKIESTVRYLGIEVDDALAIAEQFDV